MTSPPPPDQSSAIATGQALAEALNGVSGRLDQVRQDSEARDAELAKRDAVIEKYGKRNRLGLLFDIAVTLLLALGGIVVSNASHHADTAAASASAATAAEAAEHAAQISGCQAGNQYRTGVVASLDRLVTILEGTHPSAAVQKAARDYERYVLSQNEPRDCASAYPLPAAKGGGSG